MTAYSVQFATVAERHLSAINEWWQANRPSAPGLFKRELTEAVQRLVDAPYSGSPYAAPRPSGARRLFLSQTGYHIYYTIDEARAMVTIRAIWHTARGRPPRLR